MPTSTQTLAAAFAALLEGDLPALAEAADLPPVVKFLTYDPALRQVVDTPLVWSEVLAVNPTAPAGFGGANATWTRERIVQVGVTCAGQDPAAAQSLLYGYTDLILKLVMSNLTAQGTATDVQFMSADLSRLTDAGIGKLHRLALLRFRGTRWKGLGQD